MISGASPVLDVAICQLTSVDDVDSNVKQILRLLQTLESNPPQLVSLPENALYLRLSEGEKVPALSLDDARLEPLKEWARLYKSNLHLGSVPRASESSLSETSKLYNSTVLIDSAGVAREVYRKIHLFDVDVVGHTSVRESDAFSPGSRPETIEINGWKIGCSICYDLRFAELYLQYAKMGVDVILIPSAFLVPTGRAHWDILTRARAIECQAYVLAAAQGGKHQNAAGASRMTYGHSIIVDPWGEVLETCLDDSGSRVLRATLTQERLRSVRQQIPMSQHRRL